MDRTEQELHLSLVRQYVKQANEALDVARERFAAAESHLAQIEADPLPFPAYGDAPIGDAA